MKAEKIIEESIETAKKQGVRIVRGPLFSWNGDKIEACDCFGAVLIAHGRAVKGFPEGWLKELCVDILGKDTYWFWRFNYGFNQGRPMEVFREDKDSSGKKRRTYVKDDVSDAGSRLAKKLGLYK